MRCRLSLAILASVLPCLGAPASSFSQSPYPGIDLSAGEIGGRTAVIAMPASYSAGEVEILDPTGLSAHLVPQSEPDRELVYPCGEWFQPPPGRYRVWLAGEWRISPYSLKMGYSGGAVPR